MPDTPIWPIEGVALDSAGDEVADSLGARIKAIQAQLGGADTAHLPLFTGDIWYVDAAQADDTGAGDSPSTAKKTIGAAIGVAAAGDAITVKAGTYTETGLDMNLDALELWCEIGVTIDPASGTALTVSGNTCRIKGEHTISVAAGATGLLISDDECVIADSKVLYGAIGIQVTGAGVILNNSAVGFQTSISYDIQGIQGRLFQCKTVGNAATIGYRISNGADTGVLQDCTSTGHQTAGYSIATGSQDWTLLRCSSGAGDGRWVDIDHANVWSGFTFDNELSSTATMDGGATYNLYQITGNVRVEDIYGTVETQLQNLASNLYLELFSAGGAVDVTNSPGTNVQAAVEDTLLIRNEDSTNNITLASPATPAVVESTNWRDPKVPIDLIADADQTTYLRMVLSAGLNAGAIHWHLIWHPLSDNGFVTAV